MADGVTGNTSDFGSEESRFEPWSANKETPRKRGFFVHCLIAPSAVSEGTLRKPAQYPVQYFFFPSITFHASNAACASAAIRRSMGNLRCSAGRGSSS